ncbi:MAG TPA: isoprenylcysteine carboxylmethyltransferase family protein [Verrucomicrobiota bacterium]|nr:isoprenylcysteine carboxylmethyltransferase family protein [Verrucomicrobiota bacterium]
MNLESNPRSPSARTKLALIAVAGLVLMSALPITFWGWDDWRGFFAHPVRVTLIGLFVLRFGSMLFAAHPDSLGKGRPDKREREGAFMPLICLAGLLVVASPFFDRRNLWTLPGGDLTRYVGLAAVTAGLALASWAQAHLGRFFSGYLTLQEGHRLVTDGPFARIRHPRYAGAMLVFLGLPMLFRSWIGLGAGLGCIILFLIRIPREEAMLAREFGEEWSRYTQRTARLVPGVY